MRFTFRSSFTPLHQRFDLVYGTSTGGIIAALVALGHRVEEIHQLYKKYVPEVMRKRMPRAKTAALARLARAVFGDKQFTDVKTGVGIVATKWMIETPMIFKGSVAQAHGRKESFVPGFGVSIADAVQASCSAYPFFRRKVVVTSNGSHVELGDGGFCANNPTLYAIADAVKALHYEHSKVRVISIGVGVYPTPTRGIVMGCIRALPSVKLLQKSLEINTQSMEQLRSVLYNDVPTVRVNDKFSEPEMAADLMEYDLTKLNMLRQRGIQSYADKEKDIRECLLR